MFVLNMTFLNILNVPFLNVPDVLPGARRLAPPQARPAWDPAIGSVARFEGRAAEGYHSRSVSPKAWWIRLRSVSRA